ncbi:hypothetical protein IWQ60_002502 [Tieghemiomyces parasiticus]|uniref:Uncharacterized protein n=1 Tax=Tieghemiomyces parasiticus TaxID=78921 RepID=A0A9W8A4R8_9FUNG|nr:hypothetical protein IWQ60_006233 [Tieghemiomyces parasiticus]KAJ1927946.1 hypothetical protein IWQ60_002502 [Tieghemiomyces parasiticus]
MRDGHRYHKECPKVPDFDELEKDDLIGFRRARDQYLRETWIRVMELRIMQKRLQQCYRTEGVNYIQNCRALGERYLDMAKLYQMKGYHSHSGKATKLPPIPAVPSKNE